MRPSQRHHTRYLGEPSQHGRCLEGGGALILPASASRSGKPDRAPHSSAGRQRQPPQPGAPPTKPFASNSGQHQILNSLCRKKKDVMLTERRCHEMLNVGFLRGVGTNPFGSAPFPPPSQNTSSVKN